MAYSSSYGPRTTYQSKIDGILGEGPRRFRTEAEAAARLQHPNIVQVYDIHDSDGWPSLVLEYVPGVSLADHLKRKRLSVEGSVRLVERLAGAIHYAHQQGVVHRDLKPANVLLQRAPARDGQGLVNPAETGLGVPKITDFGLAKFLEADQGQTPSGAVLGTPSYMAPEQARGKSKQTGPAADIYSLGAILYELLTGQPPFRGETVLDTLMQSLSQEPVLPRQLESTIPPELERICLRCLAKDPSQRYPSAEALARDLRRFRMGDYGAGLVSGASKSLGRLLRQTLRSWRILILAATPIFVLGLIWFFLRSSLSHHPSHHLVLLSAGYETNLAVPHNVPGRHTVAQLAAWAGANAKVSVHRHALTRDLRTLDEALKDCKSPTVVLYLAAHGAADERGPYLIPEGATDPMQARVRLKDIFERLKKLPSGPKKLLILDATQVPASWTFGFFHNDFARQLNNLRKDIDGTDGLVVLSASGENQRSWVSEERRQTIFGHHVQEGLRGAASGGRSGDRITAYDLYRYVRDKVMHWARNTRAALQEPVLLGGEGRAKAMELVGVEHPYKKADPSKHAPFRVPVELAWAWSEAHQLAKEQPPPEAYTPHLWARYLETLLRYEQLLRADDPASADRLHQLLAPLHQQIVKARSRKLDAALGTLTMPVALGWASPASVAQPGAKDVQELWEKDDEVARADLGKLLAAAGDSWQKRLLRVRLAGLLLRQAEAGPPRGLKRARALLAALDEGRDPRPAEAQSLVLLERDLIAQPPEPLWGAVKNALQVRRLAEEAAVGLKADKTSADLPAYSEELLPWIRAGIDDGDKYRRHGQDLLLRKESAKDAAELLAKARGHYQKAQGLALKVRAALHTRDEALAALPYYSQWLARTRFRGQAEQNDFSRRLGEQVKLWGDVQKLDNLLCTPDAKAAAELPELTRTVSDRLAGLKDAVERRFNQNNWPVLQRSWHELDSLLVVPTPFVPPQRRLALLAKQREISETLHREVGRAGKMEPMTDEETAALNRERGRAGGKLALLALGEVAYRGQKGAIEYDEVKQAIWAAHTKEWQADLNQARDELARRWNALPAAIDERLAQGRKKDLDKARPLARAAAARARRLSGAAAARLGAIDPLDEHRHLQTYDLLCWQAERTSLDHLAAEDPGQVAYYRIAGLIYVQDARKMLPVPERAPANLLEARFAHINRLRRALEDGNR